MKFDVKIENFGMIKKANIKVSPFTVLAGPNSSGKSFITRSFYSFFSTLNKDYITSTSFSHISSSISVLNHVYSSTNSPSAKFTDLHYQLISEITYIPDLIKETLGSCTLVEQKEKTYLISKKISDVIKKIDQAIDEIGSYKKYSHYKKHLNESKRLFTAIDSMLKNPKEFLSRQISDDLEKAFRANFQAQDLDSLINFDADSASLSFNSIGSFNIKKDDIEFNFEENGIGEIQSLYNVVYLESPIYWKLRSALQQIKEDSHLHAIFRRRKIKNLTGVPEYFYDLLELIKEKTPSIDKSDAIKKIEDRIDSLVKGHLQVSEVGEISFQPKNTKSSIDLNLTATGVTSLAIISLLLKRNIIAEGSFIFFDEPEVNLHPAWQRVMVEVLCSLSKAGVNVILASHSIDMMKYIEIEMENTPSSQVSELFSVNRLSDDGVSIDNELSPYQSLAKIKDDLGKPFYEMMLEGGF